MGSLSPPKKIEYRTQPSPEALEHLAIADGLGRDFAYQSDTVRATLIGMTRMEGGELTVAVVESQVVGFLLLGLPHPQSRWGRAMLKGLYEVVSFEVAHGWRGMGVGTGVLRAALTLPWEERILLASLDPEMVEDFVAWMGHDLFLLEAMFYHNAILYERYGLGYVVGGEDMEKIHREFQAGGELTARHDGATPFRQPGMGETVRGRSWAIHDGILEGPWRAPRMYKRVGQDQRVSTFPGARW